MPVFLVNVEDEISYTRTATLIIEADDAEKAQAEAEDRYMSGNLYFSEEQIDNGTAPSFSPLKSPQALELSDLIVQDACRPAGLDADERKRMHFLRHALSRPLSKPERIEVADDELAEFRARMIRGTYPK